MIDVLGKIVSYLDSKTTLTAGTDLFYNEMPDEKDRCVLVQELLSNVAIPAQIDAEIHKIAITVREATNTATLSLAQTCWRWLLTDSASYDTDKSEETTGFITLAAGVTVQVVLYGNPVWEKTDQEGRKYYKFFFTILTKR
jgi:hypothetical protein